MRLPSVSSLLCLAGLVSVPVAAYDDANIKSIPVCQKTHVNIDTLGRDLEILTSASSAPTAFLRYDHIHPAYLARFSGSVDSELRAIIQQC
jgi:hypothetical protein